MFVHGTRDKHNATREQAERLAKNTKVRCLTATKRKLPTVERVPEGSDKFEDIQPSLRTMQHLHLHNRLSKLNKFPSLTLIFCL
jgi:hypothetical protein